MDGITVAKSVFVDGQWTDAQWDVACVDGGTGELIITAIVAGRDAPVVTALRMDMETARHLRTMAGFSGTPAAEPYDCRTTGERLQALETEQRLASRTLHAALNEIERRLAALEAWQIAVAQDGEGDDTLFRIYDAINRAERAKAAGGA